MCILCYFFFAIETLTPEEKKKSLEIRAQLKASYSGILRKNSSQRDLNEKFLLRYNEEASPKKMFKQYDFLHIMFTYGCFALIQMGYDTILPVVLSAPRSLGGLELNSTAIGYLVGISSLFLIVMGGTYLTCWCIVFIIPQVSKLMSYSTQYSLYCCLFHVCVLITPLVLLVDKLPTIVEFSNWFHA